MIRHLTSHGLPPTPVARFVHTIGNSTERISVAFQCQRPIVARQGLRGSIELTERNASVVERFGIVRLQRKRAIIAHQHLLKVFEMKKDDSKNIDRLEIVKL